MVLVLVDHGNAFLPQDNWAHTGLTDFREVYFLVLYSDKMGYCSWYPPYAKQMASVGVLKL